jgi:hypothetical protein
LTPAETEGSGSNARARHNAIREDMLAAAVAWSSEPMTSQAQWCPVAMDGRAFSEAFSDA